MIEVKHLVKKYGNHLAVDDLSFTIEPGQIYGFLGPNGAGKSTTMNIMTGYLGATEGQVLINGHDILEEPEAAKACVGYLPEQPPLYLDMTTREYLEFVAGLKKIKKAEREKEIQKVLDLVKLTDMQHRLIKNLSKGYRQRVGLAQAVLGFPEIIILDEPTVGLDPKQIIEIRELIRDLAEKHTVILSSHILAEVQEICDYIMIISHGKLVASDTPDNLEQLVQGAETLRITAKAGKETTATLLSKVDGITSVDYLAGDGKTTSVCITAPQSDTLCEDLFFAFADARCALTQLTTTRISLEDVFLELTQQDAPAEADDSENADTSDAENISANIDEKTSDYVSSDFDVSKDSMDLAADTEEVDENESNI
ncbi:MAG: ABC transporter ATP-binding protein [Lachnospiraceae bacterium]|nr:ABC transporter ATP-binding protein [Lachnospiraceae bacterium]